jgi:hypothetical protein
MPNALYRFKDDRPPADHVYLYWDSDAKEWRIWFADPEGTGKPEFPLVKNAEFDAFSFKLHRYILAHEDEPWTLVHVLEKLAGAADHLLAAHDCDCHGHEEIARARDVARRILGKS